MKWLDKLIIFDKNKIGDSTGLEVHDYEVFLFNRDTETNIPDMYDIDSLLNINLTYTWDNIESFLNNVVRMGLHFSKNERSLFVEVGPYSLSFIFNNTKHVMS